MEEYRRAEAIDPATIANYPTARTIEIDTNIATIAGAQAVADTIIAMLAAPARVLEIRVTGVPVTPLDMDGAPPRFTVQSEAFAETGARIFTMAAMTIDLDSYSTTITIKG